MTDEQIALIEASFQKVAPIAEPAAALFYARLFELDPALRPLFAQSDLAAQGRKLMAAIGFVVGNLRKPEQMLPAVRALGARHAGYGVESRHYATVGAALLDTLEKGLGADFTAETRDAWAAAYGVLAGTMIAAAETSLPRAA
jgi:hemoglobin-like flavoprotein